MNESIKTKEVRRTKVDLFMISRGILFPEKLKQTYFTHKGYFPHPQTAIASLEELLGSTLTRVGPTVDCAIEAFWFWWGRETIPAHRFSN